MSVDTYLKKKNTASYHVLRREGVEFLLSPTLARRVESIHLDLSRFMFRKTFSVEAEPKGGHVHTAA